MDDEASRRNREPPAHFWEASDAPRYYRLTSQVAAEKIEILNQLMPISPKRFSHCLSTHRRIRRLRRRMKVEKTQIQLLTVPTYLASPSPLILASGPHSTSSQMGSECFALEESEQLAVEEPRKFCLGGPAALITLTLRTAQAPTTNLPRDFSSG